MGEETPISLEQSSGAHPSIKNVLIVLTGGMLATGSAEDIQITAAESTLLRAIAAAHFLNSNTLDAAIIAGGVPKLIHNQASGETYNNHLSLAQVLYETMVEWGFKTKLPMDLYAFLVEESGIGQNKHNIILEENSFSTLTNAEYSVRLLSEYAKGHNVKGFKIYILTSQTHMERASNAFRHYCRKYFKPLKVNFNFIPIPGEKSIPNDLLEKETKLKSPLIDSNLTVSELLQMHSPGGTRFVGETTREAMLIMPERIPGLRSLINALAMRNYRTQDPRFTPVLAALEKLRIIELLKNL